jgi:hypothetical protein
VTVQRRTVHLLAAGALLLVCAYALPAPQGPLAGNEATVLGATASLWEDGDLRFDREDRVRAERWSRGDVRGPALSEGGAPGESPPVYARSLVYPLLAAPAYGVLGPRGLRVLNAALFLAAFWVAWWLVGHPRGCRRMPRSGLVLSAFFFASAAVAHALALTSTAFEAACVFFALALWCAVRERPVWGRREVLPLAVAGVLAGCAFAAQPALGLFALPPAVDLFWSRRWKAAAAFATVAAATGLGLAYAQRTVTGDPFPGWSTGPVAEHAALNAWYLLTGRHVGLLPYFPFAVFAVGLYLVDLRRSGGRTRHLLAAALALYGLLLALRLPEAAASPAAPGLAGLAAVYPVFLFLPWRLRAGRAVLAPFLAAGLWTVPAVAGAVRPPVPEAVFELHARGATYRPLPLEATLLARGRLPGYGRLEGAPATATEGVRAWLVPRETFFVTERNERGVWVLGASRSEVYVVADGPLPEIRLRLGSVSADNVATLTGADGRVVVRFDGPAKRRGTPVTIRPEPVATLDVLGDAAPERIGRFVVETSHGAVPARLNPESSDTRYLGVFLSGSPL